MCPATPTASAPWTRRRTCPAAWWWATTSTGARTAPPAIPYSDTIIYETHVKGFTLLHPGVPAGAARHLRRPGLHGRDRAPDRPRRHGGRAAARPPARRRRVPALAGPRQLLGLQHPRLLRPARRLLGRGPGRAARRPGGRVQGDGEGAARGRPRGHPRRRLQPHRRGQPPRPDAVLPRHRQPGLLPARGRRPRATTSTPPAPATRSTPTTRRACG